MGWGNIHKIRLLQLVSLVALAMAIGLRVWSLMPAADQKLFTISGNVIDAGNGNPLAGVNVLVVDRNSVSMTGESGFYQALCRSGTHYLRFLLKDYENFEEVITVIDEDLTINVALKPRDNSPQTQSSQAATITGKVTDAKTGTPVTGAVVGTENHRVITDSGGVYSLNADVGTYNLTVGAKGFETKTASINVSEKKTYTLDVALSSVPVLKATPSPNLIFSCTDIRESTITAVVKKADGSPAVGVEVSFGIRANSKVEGKLDSQTVVTNEEGTAKAVWTCRSDPIVENLNVIYAQQLSYWTYITVSGTVEGQLISDTITIIVQKEACHRSC